VAPGGRQRDRLQAGAEEQTQGEAEEQNGQGFNVKMYTTKRICTDMILINRA